MKLTEQLFYVSTFGAIGNSLVLLSLLVSILYIIAEHPIGGALGAIIALVMFVGGVALLFRSDAHYNDLRVVLKGIDQAKEMDKHLGVNRGGNE